MLGVWRKHVDGAIAANASWSYIAGKKGEYAYSCTFHPTMHGKLTVQ